MRNIDLVKTTLQMLKNLHVEEVVVCAGARNVPLLLGLEQENFKIQSYFEERSAAFYALGQSHFSRQPVAIITTSGTAVAELFPAVIEAYYQCRPLIIITADRPKNYRGSGAPQAIEQAQFFQSYVADAVDWDVHTQNFSLQFSDHKPLHINLCFDEPLMDGDYAQAEVLPFHITELKNNETSTESISVKNPLFVISELSIDARQTIKAFLKEKKWFFYPEFLSGLIHDEELKLQQINHLEGFSDLQKNYGIQSIIRIGGIPTHRLWRDLENKYQELDVVSFSERPFKGLARASQLYCLSSLKNLNASQTFQAQVLAREVALKDYKFSLLEKYSDCEPAFVAALSKCVGDQPLYIGNSLPIREWDLFSVSAQKTQAVYANRGANGIDGQISAFLGWSTHFAEAWCLVGDLTALYDLAALGLQRDHGKKRLVIMNNSGGKIFNRLFKDKKYLNAQAVSFAGWAKLWNWEYLLIKELKDFNQLLSLDSSRVIIELQPNHLQTEEFWQAWDQQCRL